MRSTCHLVTLLAVAAMGCSPGITDGEASGGTGARTTTLSGLSDTSGTLSTGAFMSTGTGTTTGNGCSADLQSVTDANGNVVQACPPDQGCNSGQCVAACDAASASQGSIGCGFYAPDSPFYGNALGGGASQSGACYAVFLANTWGRAAKLTITRGGQSFDATQFGYTVSGMGAATVYTPLPSTGLPPSEVAVLFLSSRPGSNNGTTLECPKQAAVEADAAVEGSGTGSAFQVESDTPLTAYDILPYGGAQTFLPSASLLFPSSALGTNYYAVAPHPDGGGSLWVLVAGTVDDTHVTIAPPQTLPGGGSLPSAPAGQATAFTVGAGQTLQWIGADPTGAIIQSDHPVAVFAGSTYLQVVSATQQYGGGQDSAHQQLLHIKALGSEYVGPNIVTREPSLALESIPYRLVGVVDGTTLTYDPAPPAGAPTTLNAGQVVEFQSSPIFSVTSQDADHPFGITHYMPGTYFPTRPGCTGSADQQCELGDEDWVNLLPPAQFLQRYVFFTDPTYATTNLVITRVKGANGFSDVSIDCLSSPVSGWLPVGNGGKYEVAYVDLVRGSVQVDQCGGSRHVATSAGKFGINVWGTDTAASYGYPAGGNIGSINTVVVPPVPQ